ncbi:glycosyltransferase family 1 protein [Chryseotalea sanaruensis]|uniref:Glycosyltransferase family 1 protein n=1 Tax=Chryseotalea sanaruensis TaxID=2482724 RepID=A0A401UAZ6_9BACT|nr:glycosyltransferase family 4 protein [Chryseotalea sanaruensis]GCC52051.1 glycosyltransferase family 1 protein [Chryseotalea sanaruensis]
MIKPKILIIENSTHVTGALKSIVRVASDLRLYYSFVFVLPSKSQGRQLIEKFDFELIYELPMKELSRKVSAILLYVPYLIVNSIKIRSIVKKEKIDLIHSNDLYNLTPVLYKLMGGDKPYFSHIRFLPNGFPPLLFRFWFLLHDKFAQRIIVVSNYLKNQLPLSPKVEWIPNELPIRETHNLMNDESRTSHSFLYLSNYIAGKGQNFALEAFAKIADQLPNWKLRFVGGDMGLKKNRLFKESLKERAFELGVSHKVEWIDFIEDTELEYKRADIALNFSESESFSITCLEALFYGAPLIATDCGGPAEIIDHNDTGLLTPNRDINAMSEAMLRLARDKNLRNKFRDDGRRRSRERFSIENTSYRLKTLYSLTLGESTKGLTSSL